MTATRLEGDNGLKVGEEVRGTGGVAMRDGRTAI